MSDLYRSSWSIALLPLCRATNQSTETKFKRRVVLAVELGIILTQVWSGFETYLRRVASLSKTFYCLKVLVIPRKRWHHPDMTEILLIGTLNLNTNKQTKTLVFCIYEQCFPFRSLLV